MKRYIVEAKRNEMFCFPTRSKVVKIPCDISIYNKDTSSYIHEGDIVDGGNRLATVSLESESRYIILEVYKEPLPVREPIESLEDSYIWNVIVSKGIDDVVKKIRGKK